MRQPHSIVMTDRNDMIAPSRLGGRRRADESLADPTLAAANLTDDLQPVLAREPGVDHRYGEHGGFEPGLTKADDDQCQSVASVVTDVDEFARALRAVGEPIFGIDATGISMGRLLSYLFEVTERFGMETRTELILLQRTMVVVEGVARSLNPHINIWQVAQPVVEDYIKQSIGPRAVLSDLAKTTRVLARFGPRLPQLVEAALIRQAGEQITHRPRWRLLRPALAGAVIGALAVIGVQWLI